jgi:hypothetical protein
MTSLYSINLRDGQKQCTAAFGENLTTEAEAAGRRILGATA